MPAYKSASAELTFWVLVLIVVAADLGSKHWAFEALSDGAARVVLPGWLQFRTLQNTGAVFGMGKGRIGFFVVASFIAMGFVFYLFAHSAPHQRFLQGMLALIMGGAAGNMYDRLAFGYVRDFIEITATIGRFPIWQWVFNVADSALVVGVLGIVLGWLINHRAVSFHAAR